MRSNNNIGCVAFLFLISIGYLGYLFFKSDPQTEKLNKERTEWRHNFLTKFNYDPDRVGKDLISHYLSTNLMNGTNIKRKCLVVDENKDMKMDYSIMGGLEDFSVAYKIEELKTIIIYKYVNGESHYEQGYEVSTDIVELTYIDINSQCIIKKDIVHGGRGYSISNGRRSHTKHSDVSIKDAILAIEKTLNNLN